jgi:hypothetical protein
MSAITFGAGDDSLLDPARLEQYKEELRSRLAEDEQRARDAGARRWNEERLRRAAPVDGADGALRRESDRAHQTAIDDAIRREREEVALLRAAARAAREAREAAQAEREEAARRELQEETERRRKELRRRKEQELEERVAERLREHRHAQDVQLEYTPERLLAAEQEERMREARVDSRLRDERAKFPGTPPKATPGPGWGCDSATTAHGDTLSKTVEAMETLALNAFPASETELAKKTREALLVYHSDKCVKNVGNAAHFAKYGFVAHVAPQCHEHTLRINEAKEIIHAFCKK